VVSFWRRALRPSVDGQRCWAQLNRISLDGRSVALEHQDILYALSEVATAFAGFAGIVIVLGGRDRGTWQPGDVPLLIGLLACSLGVVFFSFTPDLVHAAHLDLGQAWRFSAFLFASYHLVVILSQYRSRRRVLDRDAPLFGSRPLLGVHYIGFCFAVPLFLTAVGILSSWLFFFYLLNLLWLLLMSAYAFAIFLVESISSKLTGRGDS
jgi:hypothetical protein